MLDSAGYLDDGTLMMRFKAFVASLVTALLAALSAVTANPSVASTEEGGAFVPVPYARIVSDAQATRSTPAAVTVLGVAGVPSQGVRAVLVDVTAKIAPQQGTGCITTNCTNSVSVTRQPSTTAAPAIANIEGGLPITNTVAVEPDALGRVFVNVGGYNAQFSLDVQGYVTAAPAAGGGFVPIGPKRVYDSSSSNLLWGEFAANTTYEVQVAGTAGIPSNATAVFANVTVTGPNSGSIRAGEPGPDFATRPTFGSYIGSRGSTNLGGALKLGSDGKLALQSTSGQAKVMVDVQGYFSGDGGEGGGFTPVTSASIYKSGPFGYAVSSGALQPGEVREIPVAGVAGVPTTDAPSTASAVLVTVAGKSRKQTDSALSIYNPDAGTGTVANLRWNTQGTPAEVVEQTTAAVEVSAAGTIAVKNIGAWPADVQIAAQGWFSARVEDVPADDDLVTPPLDPGTLCDDGSCEPRMVAGIASAPVNDVQIFAVPQASDNLTTPDSTADYLTLDDAQTTISGYGFEVGVSADQVPAGYVNSEGVVDVRVAVETTSGTEIGTASVQAVTGPANPNESLWADPSTVLPIEETSSVARGANSTAQDEAVQLSSAASQPAPNGVVIPLATNVVEETNETPSGGSSTARAGAPPGWTCTDTYKSTQNRPTVVGTAYPAKDASAWFSITQSNGGDYGVALSANGSSGWAMSEYRWRKNEEATASWGASKTSVSYRISTQYSKYKVNCQFRAGTKRSYYEWRPVREIGVPDHVSGLDRPDWTGKPANCVPLGSLDTFTRKRTNGHSYSNSLGVKFANGIGIDLGLDRNYSKTTTLNYKGGNKAVTLCGNNAAPDLASKVMVK